MNKLKRNIIRCRHCDDILESKSTHHFLLCSCGLVGIDGGLDYEKRIYPSNPAEKHYEELSEYDNDIQT